MPRMISFSLTTPQFLDGSKDVTRRMGWLTLAAGADLIAVEKAMGLGKGEKVKVLGNIRVVNFRRELLLRMLDEPEYGRSELIREGFPLMTVKGFIEMFCDTHKNCAPSTIISRIAFRRV